MASVSRQSRTLLGVIALTTVLLGTAAGAQAVTWGSISVSYNDIVRAKASGSFTNENPKAVNTYNLSDVSRDNNNVYGRTGIYSGPKQSSPTTDLVTPEIDYFNSPKSYYYSEKLGGHPMHAASRVCVQLQFPVGDACSGWADVSFDY